MYGEQALEGHRFLNSGLCDRGLSRPVSFPSEWGRVCVQGLEPLDTKIEYLSVWIFLSWQWTYSGRGTETRFFFLCFSKNTFNGRNKTVERRLFSPVFFGPKQAKVKQAFSSLIALFTCKHIALPHPHPRPRTPPSMLLDAFASPPPSLQSTTVSLIIGLITETSHTVVWRDIWFKHPHSRNIISLRKKKKIGACSMSVTWNKLPVPLLLLLRYSILKIIPAYFATPKVSNPNPPASDWRRERKKGALWSWPPQGMWSTCLSRGEKMCWANLWDSLENPEFVSLCRAQNSLYVLLSLLCAWRFPSEISPAKAFPVRGGELLFSGKYGEDN